MKKVISKFIIVSIVVGLLSTLPLQSHSAKAQELNLLPKDEQNVQDLLADRIKKKIKQGTYFMFGIEAKLKNSSQELNLLHNNVRALQNKINESKTHVNDLQSQLLNLSNLIAVNKNTTRAVALQIAARENNITTLRDEMKQAENLQHKNLASLNQSLITYYLHTNSFFDTESDEPKLLALLATPETTGDVMAAHQYLLFLHNATEDLARDIILTQNSLDEKSQSLEKENSELDALRTLLNGEKRDLTAAEESRQRLLQETQGKQIIYEMLLELSKKEEEQVSVQIERLKENFAFFKGQLDVLKQNSPGADFGSENFFPADGSPLTLGNSPYAWPVPPNLGISAFFHDASYKKALGVEHNAIDIRVAQGSNVKAAADGVVTKAADNGMAYSYVIIAHPDNVITLYGHLSDIFVTEGQIVRHGETIGLSGGMPGTKGAGWLTTGAHLHFEMFKDWKHVDPLEYLPLEYLPVSSLPEKYFKKMTGDEEAKIPRE